MTSTTPTRTKPASTARRCSVARTLDVVGEKWALLAVREVFLGCRRFEEIVRNTGAPRDTLAARLKSLVDHGVLERRAYSERPPRDEYVLTPAGRELYPLVLTAMQWGDRHRDDGDGPPMVLEHHCGARLNPQLVCSSCGEPVRPREVSRVAART